MGLLSRIADRNRAVDRDQLFALVARMYKQFLSSCAKQALKQPPGAIFDEDDADFLCNVIVFAHNQTLLYATGTQLLTHQRGKPTSWEWVSDEDRAYVSKQLLPHCVQFAKRLIGDEMPDSLRPVWERDLAASPVVEAAPIGPRLSTHGTQVWFVQDQRETTVLCSAVVPPWPIKDE